MTELEKLRNAKSLSDFASLLGYKPKAFSYILYKIDNEKKYIAFTIPKKTGGERRIKAPIDQLKTLQKRLAELLNGCFEEIFIKDKHNRSISYGFRKDHSIIKNAKNHKNKRHVFNIDLQDFFPSINFGRVRGFFIKNVHFQLVPEVATIIAQIACHNNELPQGSPCSPVISNLIGHLLDIRMVYLAKKAQCTYTRYADDLTFSTNKKEFPEIIASQQSLDSKKWIVGKKLKKEIIKVGFIINENKTSLQNKTVRQIATGLVVNKKVNIKREYYRKAKSMCHALFQSDQFYIGSKLISLPANLEKAKSDEVSPDDSIGIVQRKSQSEEKVLGSIKQLEGILSFIYQVKQPHYVPKNGEKKVEPTAVTNLYRKFLFYKHYFSLDRPLIICEGQTDIIYLKCALMQLEKEYTTLIQKTDNGFVFKIQFLNFTKNLKDVFALPSGTPGLAKLMDIYKEYMAIYYGNGKKHPVIMLVDNDSGAKEIMRKLKDKDPAKPFFYYAENLYIVNIPFGDGDEDMAIEDLFDKETLTTKIENKIFNRKKKIDIKTEYGKTAFATSVVKANRNKIKFDGFKGIFDLFTEVIEDYKAKN